MPPSFTIGLTGGIGSGKSLVADLFAARGAGVIDTDQIAHTLTRSGGSAIPALRRAFGDGFIDAADALDRARMRVEVFSNPTSKAKLESILHPMIRAEAERLAGMAQTPYLLFVVPLLIESGEWKQRVARVLVIDCPEELQVQRVMQRNHWQEAQVRAVMAAQASRSTRLAAADDVILNDGDIGALQSQVARLHAIYLRLSGHAQACRPDQPASGHL